MVIYLGVDSHIRILFSNGKQQLNPAARKESGPVLYIGMNSTRGHTQVDRSLKGYWL